MPRIPTSQGPRIREQSFRSGGFNVRQAEPVDQTRELQAASQVVNQVVDFANKERAKAEQVEFQSLQNKMREIYNTQLNDKEGGYKNRQRKEALDMMGQYQDDFRQLTDGVIKGVKNDRLVERARLYRDQLANDFDNQVNIHAAREGEKYDDETTMASLDSLVNTAAENYKDYSVSSGDSFINSSLKEQRDIIDAYADRKGLSKERVEQLKTEKASELHYKVITKALANNEDLLAKDYYNEIKKRKGELTADVSTKLDKLINVSNIRGEAQRRTSDILELNLNKTESLAQVDRMVERGEDPELIDEVRRRVRQRWNERDVVERYQKERTNMSIVDTIDTMGFEAIPAEALTELSERENRELVKYAQTKAKGSAPITDSVVKYSLEKLAADPSTRQKFLDTNLVKYINKLNPQDFSRFRNLKDKMRQGKEAPGLKQLRTNQQVVSGVADILEIKDDKDRELFESRVMERAQQWQEVYGKEITNEELELIANREGMKVDVTDRWYWGDKTKRIFQLDPEERPQEVEYKNIPPKYRFEIQELLKREGRPYTEDNVEAKMREILRRGR